MTDAWRLSKLAGQLDAAGLPPSGGGPDVPTGVICMWSGLLSGLPSGWFLCDGTNGTPDLRSVFIKGAAAGVNPGVTGGASTHTHSGHSNHVVTQPAAHTNHTFTQPANHTFTQPNGHAAHVVTQPVPHVVTQPTAAAESAHTHAYSTVVAHVHGLNVQGGTTAAVTGTHIMTSTAVGGSARAITAGDAGLSTGSASGTTAAGSAHTHAVTGTAVDAHSGATVDAHSAHAGGAVDAHSGGAVDAHSAHSGTAVDAHSAHNSVSNEPTFYSLAFIMKG